MVLRQLGPETAATALGHLAVAILAFGWSSESSDDHPREPTSSERFLLSGWPHKL